MSFKIKNTIFSNQSASTQSFQFTPLTLNLIPNDNDILIWDANIGEWITRQALTLASVSPAEPVVGVEMVNPPFDTTPTIKNIQAGDEIQIIDNYNYITINSTAISNVSNAVGPGEELVKPPSGPTDTTRVLKTLVGAPNDLIQVSSNDNTVYISTDIKTDYLNPSYGNVVPTGCTASLQSTNFSRYVRVGETALIYGFASFNHVSLNKVSTVQFQADILPISVFPSPNLYTTLTGFTTPVTDTVIELTSVAYISSSRISITYKLINSSTTTSFVTTIYWTLMYQIYNP